MKNYLILIICSLLIAQSCEKSEDTYKPLTSYTVVNATIDQTSVKVYAAEHEIYWKPLPASEVVVPYRAANFGAYAGQNIIRAVSNADTTKTIFSSTKAEKFDAATVNTLFLAGDSTNGYEGVFLNNETMNNHTDSVIGIRFINLSPNSGAVNITLSTSPTTHEAAELAYKQISDFTTYPSTLSTTAMVLEVRNSADSLLATYTLPATPGSPYTTASLNHARFKNLTLVVKGLAGQTGANALGMFPVAHY